MEKIETSPTSAKTVDATPIVLRETNTTRLVFRPTFVDNAGQPKACINGEFVFERKSSSGDWAPLNDTSLSTIKVGEQYKLEMHSSEVLKLMEALAPMYRLYFEEKGLHYTRRTYVRMEQGVGLLLKQSEAELQRFLNDHPDDALAVLGKMLKWVTSGTTSAAARQLAALDADKLPGVTALLGLSTLKSAIAYWEANRENPAEGFWQDALTRHSFVLSQLFAQPIVVISGRAYLGGKAIDDSGGSYSDVLTKFSSTGGLGIIELKTPKTPLLGSEYRGSVFPPSTELVGAISQVLKYRHTLSTSFAGLVLQSGEQMTLGNPPCFVVIGDSTQLTTQAMRESFDVFRAELAHVRVITYDELFEKTRTAARILEGLGNE